MKRIIVLLLTLILLLSLCACSQPSGGNSLFDSASPLTSMLSFSWYTETENMRSSIEDQDNAEMILAELSAVTATPVDNWTPKKASYPIYSIWIYSADGHPLEFTWTNGYLIAQDSSVYKFNYDFSKLRDYDSELTEYLNDPAYIPCLRYLTQYDNRWYPKFLIPAEQKTAQVGLSMEILSQENGVSVRITNNGTKTWDYGEIYSLEVLLDGQWYTVPTLPDKNYGFFAIGYTLHPGSSTEKTYYLDMYGDLPSGIYRLVVENITAEFIP